MTTLTLDTSATRAGDVSARTTGEAGLSLRDRLRAVYHAFIAGQERRAQVRVDGHLASLNDETLIDLGLDPALVRHPDADPSKRFYL